MKKEEMDLTMAFTSIRNMSVNAEFKCLKTDGVQCPQTAGENGKLFGLAIFIKSTLH